MASIFGATNDILAGRIEERRRKKAEKKFARRGVVGEDAKKFLAERR